MRVPVDRVNDAEEDMVVKDLSLKAIVLNFIWGKSTSPWLYRDERLNGQRVSPVKSTVQWVGLGAGGGFDNFF